MPVTPSAISLAIQAAGPELVGPAWRQLTLVLGTAVAAWALSPSNLALTGITAGAAGGGAVAGKLTVPPAPLPVAAALAAATVVGFEAPAIARAVGLGVAAAFSASALYQGASVGVGTGSDVSRVTVSNGPALTAAISAAAASIGYVGPAAPSLAVGLGVGIAGVLLGGTGIGVVVGQSGPLPGSGTSFSRVT